MEKPLGQEVALRKAIESVQHLSDPVPPWKDILQDAHALIGGASASFIVFEGRQLVTLEQTHIDAAAERDYIGYFHSQDILLRPGNPWPAGSWVDTQAVLTPRERQRNGYYVDFMLKHRMRQMLAFVIEDGPTRSAALTVQREAVVEDTASVLETPDVQAYVRALQKSLARRRLTATRWLSSVGSAFDSFGEAACLVSDTGAVHWRSAGFDALLGDRPVFCIREGRLYHPEIRIHMTLRETIRKASQSSAPIRLALPSGPAASIGLELVCAQESLGLNKEPNVFIRVRRHQAASAPSPESLGLAFGLSAAESRVLAAMATGQTPGDYAGANGLSVHTVRKHIANLMSKMRCSRHADAIRMAVSVAMG